MASTMEQLFGLSLKKKAFFYRELATMVDAGVGLVKALRLAAQHSVPNLADAMARQVEEGNSLSSVLERYPHLFGDFEVKIVAAGEAGGTLDERLKDLATNLEGTYEMQQKVISKVWYPVVVLHMAVFVPTLPLLVAQGPAVYAATTLGVVIPAWALILGLIAGYRLSARTSGFRTAVDTALGMVPFLGQTLRTLASARFLDCLGQLLAAGMPPTRAIQLAAQACGSPTVRARLLPAAERVDAGQTLTRALAGTGALPDIVVQMLQTGEEAGRLPEMLEKVAAYMHQEVEHVSQRVMTVLPILLLLLVGGIVGFIVISFYVGQIQSVMQGL